MSVLASNAGLAVETAAIRYATGDCSLGSILVAQSEAGVCAILLGDEPRRLAAELRGVFPGATPVADDDGAFDEIMAQVVRFVEAPGAGLDLPLDVRGTSFQRQVWEALREIPAGKTASYSDIAQRIGAPKEAYAVGEACAANVIAVAIPCHRVVRKDGTLAGYRWGVARKRVLLDREASA